MSKQFVVTCTTEAQAYALRDALELYARICIGQFHQISELMRAGVIPMASDGSGQRSTVPVAAINAAEDALTVAKACCGNPANGGMSIGNPHVHDSGKRAWELLKVVQKTLAEERHEDGAASGVHHNGLMVRYTDDPAPTCAAVSFDGVPAG